MKQYRLAAAVALVGLVLSGCDSKPKVELESPAQKASYGIGLNMGKSLAQEGIDDLDPKAVALGIEDAVGKKDQKLTDQQLTEAFAALQKRAEEKMTKVSEDNAKAGKKFLEENGKKPGVITTASGLQYEVVKKADGPQPKPTDVVTVHYEGKLVDGTVFDSSIKRGTPIDLPVNGVIPGWVGAATDARRREDQAVHPLRAGLRRPEPEPGDPRQLRAGVRPGTARHQGRRCRGRRRRSGRSGSRGTGRRRKGPGQEVSRAPCAKRPALQGVLHWATGNPEAAVRSKQGRKDPWQTGPCPTLSPARGVHEAAEEF